MINWMIGISIVGYFVSLMISISMRTRRLEERLGPSGVVRWRIASLMIAVVGMGLAFLFAWLAWHFGKFLAPLLGKSKTTVAIISACIFGLGGSALSGVLIVIHNEFLEDRAKHRQ